MNNLNLDPIKKKTNISNFGVLQLALRSRVAAKQIINHRMLQLLWLKLISQKSTKCRRTRGPNAQASGSKTTLKTTKRAQTQPHNGGPKGLEWVPLEPVADTCRAPFFTFHYFVVPPRAGLRDRKKLSHIVVRMCSESAAGYFLHPAHRTAWKRTHYMEGCGKARGAVIHGKTVFYNWEIFEKY